MNHEKYIARCIALASIPKAKVGLNPNVGAVIVNNNKIIGEGYYKYFGSRHAEVDAIENVRPEHRDLIRDSTLYVSLEPCNFHGKTPPCSDRILREEFKDLVVGCKDPNPKIAGTSIAYLRSKNVRVTCDVLKEECEELIQPFKINILENRPFITLKFAQSKDFYMGDPTKQIWLSHHLSKIYSHRLRSINHAILVGTNTAIVDNPSLTNRLYTGDSPLRIVIDKNNRMPLTHQLLQDEEPLILLNTKPRDGLKKQKEQWSMDINLSVILNRLFTEKKVGRMIVEGGAKTIEQFIRAGYWDQAIVINTPKILGGGVKSPMVSGRLKKKWKLATDSIDLIQKI